MEELLANASDEDLLRKIAAEKNPSAFEVFAQRHTKSIFNLALHLTSNRMAAEEIVQETLLGLWNAARTYDATKGVARTWVLRSAVYIARKEHRRRSQEKSRIMRRWAMGGPWSLITLSDNSAPETDESKVALRHLLNRLPDIDRQLVSLYFGGEISQKEISRMLGIPQRTISRRLADSLQRLKEGMKRAGFAGWAVEAWPLTDALLTTYATPPGLSIRLPGPRHVESRSRKQPVGLRPASQPGRGTRTGRLLVLLSLAALAAGSWALLGMGQGWRTNRTASVTRALPTPVLPPSRTQPGRFFRSYNFDSAEQLKDFEVSGAVRHSAGKGNGGGCVHFSGQGTLRLRLTPELLPLRVTYEHTQDRRAKGTRSSLAFPGLRNWVGFQLDDPSKGGRQGWDRFSSYITEGARDHWVEPDGRQCVFLNEKIKAGQVLELGGIHLLLDNLTLEQLPPEAVPDLSEFREAYRRLGPGLPVDKETPVPWFGAGQRGVRMLVYGNRNPRP